MEFEHILAPVDFSDSSTRSLTHAAALARWYDAKLTVLHVAPTFQTLPVKGELGVPVHVVESATEEEALRGIRRLLDENDIAAQAAPVARAGDASTVIVDEATKNNADLVVMGTHGRRGFRRLLLG